jgi:polar amino acid transport system substrate-binding protein
MQRGGPGKKLRSAPRRARAVRCVLLTILLGFTVQALAQQVPFVPNPERFGRRADQGKLSFCVDQRDPDWPVAQAIGTAIAESLLLEPDPQLIENKLVTQSLEELYPAFLERCDLFLGFKLLPEAYPQWLALTRPYYEASYVFVAKDPQLKSLADVPFAQPIGSTIGTAADLALIQYLKTLASGNRWQRIPLASNEAAVNAVESGTVATALVWAPALWALQQQDPQLANLHRLAPSPLPVTTVGIGAALLAEQSFLQNSLDQAIASLTADGTIASIIEEFNFPARAAR